MTNGVVQPKVSVLVPVWNGERHLGESLQSVLGQTHRDLELIAIDDGSGDRSVEIVQSFALRDPRVRLLRKEHSGIPKTLNTGLRAARAPWIALLDQDDVMLPDRLERQLAFAATCPDAAVIATRARYINAAGKAFAVSIPAPIRSRAELDAWRSTGEPIGLLHPTVMLRRDAALAVGGWDEAVEISGDHDMWLRLADAGYLILQQDEILTLYRVHPGSVSALRAREGWVVSRWILARAAARRAGDREPTWAEFAAAQRARPLPMQLADSYRSLVWALYRRAGAELPNGRWLTGAGHLLAATVLRPGYVVNRLHAQLGRWSERRRGPDRPRP